MRIVSLAILFLGICNLASGQRYFTLSGSVKDSSGQVVPGASIRLRNDNLGTATDSKGFFKLRLEEGYYEIVVSGVGYENYSLNMPMNKDVSIRIILKENQTKLKEIEVNNKRHDPSWDIIQRVIANREKINNGLLNYKCSGYIKASDILIVDSVALKKKEKKKKKQPLNIDSVEAEIKKSPEIPNMNFAEIDLIKYWGKPDKIKEERSGVRILGDKYALYFLSVTDGEFDFYKNQVELGKLTDVRYISPFSPGATVSYRYKLLGSYYEGRLKVYRIKITPRKIGNALFNGETEVYDSLWVIKSVKFMLNPNHIPLYNSFEISQTYDFSHSGYMLLQTQGFTYTKKAKYGQREGKTNVHYNGYEINLSLPPRFFGNEISSAFDSAYDRKAEWWDKQRKDTLSKNEIIYTHYSDSIHAVRTSKAYLDSIDKVFNKVTPLKLLWWVRAILTATRNYVLTLLL